MIILKAIKISNCTKRKIKRFRILKIPFKNEKELEMFRINREYKENNIHPEEIDKNYFPAKRVYLDTLEI